MSDRTPAYRCLPAIRGRLMHRLAVAGMLAGLLLCGEWPDAAHFPLSDSAQAEETSGLTAEQRVAAESDGDRDAAFQACRARIEQDVRDLSDESFRGRRGADAARAADYVQREFSDLGLQPLFRNESYLQDIPGPRDEQGRQTRIGRNVGAILPGSEATLNEEYVLIAAHHDHLGLSEDGIFHGADDNASGVAMVLEVARLLTQAPIPPPRSIIFVSFDLEEHLLFGSRWFVAHPPIPLKQLKLVIVADMLGRSLGDLPLQSLFLFGAEHGSGLRELLEEISPPSGMKSVLLNQEFVGTRSDYGPFRDRQIPFLFASTGQSRDYHTVRDTADRIDYAQLTSITSFLAETVTRAAGAESPPEWIDQPELTLEEVSAVLTIVETIEEAASSWNLSLVQKLFVTQTRQRATRILKQGFITPEDRRWLTRATQMMLLTVF